MQKQYERRSKREQLFPTYLLINKLPQCGIGVKQFLIEFSDKQVGPEEICIVNSFILTFTNIA